MHSWNSYNNIQKETNEQDNIASGLAVLFAKTQGDVKMTIKSLEESFTGVEESLNGVEESVTGVEESFPGVEESATGVEEVFTVAAESATGVCLIY